MEIKEMTQSQFAKALVSAGNETYQTTFENDVWYEQVTFEDTLCRHKLLTLKKTTSELLARKALESKPSVEPIRLRAHSQGPVVALVFNSKTTLFYHLFMGTKSEMALAKRLVVFFSKSFLPSVPRQPEAQPKSEAIFAA